MMDVLTDGESIYASHHLGAPRLRQGSGMRSGTGDAAATEKRYGKQESVTGDRCTDNLQLGMGWLSTARWLVARYQGLASTSGTHSTQKGSILCACLIELDS